MIHIIKQILEKALSQNASGHTFNRFPASFQLNKKGKIIHDSSRKIRYTNKI